MSAELFKVCPPVPNEDTIDYFESLLARARTGEIQGFAIAIQKGIGTANGWAGLGNNSMSIIGELEAMKVDFIRSNVDQRFDCCGEVIDS